MSSPLTQSLQSEGCLTYTPRRPLIWTATVIALGLIAACDTPGVTLVDPDVTGGEDRSWTITVFLEDADLAAALGWSNGVPGATVSLHRLQEEFDLLTGVTDSSGQVRFDPMLPGQYRIAAERVLQAGETGPTGGVLRAFGDGVRVWKDSTALDLHLRADRRGSLVISEIRTTGRYGDASWNTYDGYQYFEIYNNSDTTVYLDGMLWGRTFHYLVEAPASSCAGSEPLRNDPAGIWASYFHQFPGSGTEYAVAPGQSILVAQDAVDHTVVHPNLPDLTVADFELEGPADVDNPEVPNMPYVGLASLIFQPHGVLISCVLNPCFLAAAADPASLERTPYPSNLEWARIPMEAVIDVVSAGIWVPAYDRIGNPCAIAVGGDMDRLEYPSYPIYYDPFLAFQRKVLRVSAQGRPILQDVNVSFVDLWEGPRSPGSIEH
ncbi:MAG: hypothetical protein AMS18_07550 [Gemmatimonas sp. SG8_17]|nr:MAG: hypothetical protein AMS18_07550 [Gemmatimonas sp. SG8_17]